MKKHFIICALIMLTSTKVVYGQTIKNPERFVNQSHSSILNLPKMIKNDKITIVYQNTDLTWKGSVIVSKLKKELNKNIPIEVTKNNNRFSFQTSKLKNNIANTYFSKLFTGGTPQDIWFVANKIAVDIYDEVSLLGDPKNDHFKNNTVAQDILLLKTISNSNPDLDFDITKSTDTQIPINVVSYHPMLLVNGKREPKLITTKNILIK